MLRDTKWHFGAQIKGGILRLKPSTLSNLPLSLSSNTGSVTFYLFDHGRIVQFRSLSIK